jgi:hypothetical protein
MALRSSHSAREIRAETHLPMLTSIDQIQRFGDQGQIATTGRQDHGCGLQAL